MTGKIIKGIAGFYYVYAQDNEIYECRAKGIFRKDNQKPLVGDQAEIVVLDEAEKEGNIIRLLPRKSSLVRPAVANVDQAFVVFAAENPAPNYLLLDRFLVMMEKQEIPCAICFNKMDLPEAEDVSRMAQIYEKAGYPVFRTSAREGAGVREVREFLRGKTTVTAGPSGVGKSSLTNSLLPQAQMKTGEISRKLKRGKHTTRHSEIVPVGDDTFLVDTPGFSSLYLPEMEAESLSLYFREFRSFEKDCRFQGCQHLKEPDCGVKRALETGSVSRERYENYRLLRQELSEKRRY
ncbi:MAG: ribosome small subunit-dependent GTPase A [Blautia sp.]|nr:ribosome small subunit-dependent GTPase A [Blautia sp.]